MNRRNFNTKLGWMAMGLLSNPGIKMAAAGKRVRKVKRLREGDTIGLIAPAGAISEVGVEKAILNIEALGFKLKEGKHLRGRYGYLAGKDEERLSDLHSMYIDPGVDGIWCVRGGYGCTRLLDQLDYSMIRKNAKALIGYSDITALLNAIYMHTGIIGFHGPVASSTSNVYNHLSFKGLIMNVSAQFEIEPYVKSDQEYQAFQVIKEGRGEGRLVGGNLSLLSSMAGTRHEVDFKDKLVLIEDIGEDPYRIDRMLTQLISGSNLRKARGILLGQFKGCEADDLEKSLSLIECLEDRIKPLQIPSALGYNFGHVDHNFTFPIGARASFNTNSPQLRILESAVE